MHQTTFYLKKTSSLKMILPVISTVNQHLCGAYQALNWNLQLFSSFVQCPGSKRPRQIKDEEGFTLYLCLCCVWPSTLFSPGRLQAGIKVSAALNVHLYRSTHTLTLSGRHYHTHSGHILFDSRKTSETRHTENSVHGVHGTTKLLFPHTTLQLVSSKELAFSPGGNIPRFCNVEFLLLRSCF